MQHLEIYLLLREREREREPRFLGELAQARNDGIDIERASTTWLPLTVLFEMFAST